MLRTELAERRTAHEEAESETGSSRGSPGRLRSIPPYHWPASVDAKSRSTEKVSVVVDGKCSHLRHCQSNPSLLGETHSRRLFRTAKMTSLTSMDIVRDVIRELVRGLQDFFFGVMSIGKLDSNRIADDSSISQMVSQLRTLHFSIISRPLSGFVTAEKLFLGGSCL